MRVISTILLIFISIQGFSQTRIIRGKVTFKGNLLPGVSILEKNTLNQCMTHANGDFELEISDKEEVVLCLSYIGPYMEKKITKEDTFIHIKFKPEGQIYGYLYSYAGVSLMKSSLIKKTEFGPTFSIGYAHYLRKNEIGTELNLIPNINPNQNQYYYQIGLPIFAYICVFYNFRIIFGGGYYWTINNNFFPNEVKLTSGLIYRKNRWSFDLRYNHGLINDDVIRLMNQNINFGIRYNINI